MVSKCTEKSEDWDIHWCQFEERFGQKILSYIYREFRGLTGRNPSNQNHEAIQDLRQDVYIKLLNNDARALKNFKGKDEKSFLAYLYTISRRIVIDFMKNAKNSQELHFSDLKFPSEDVGLENNQIEPISSDTLDEIEEGFCREQIVEVLKRRYRSRSFQRDLLIFKLFYFRGLSSQSIHDGYNFELSVSGIETLVSRMRIILKESVRI